MSRRIGLYVIASLGLLVGPAAGTGRGGEFYYALIFGSQSSPKTLRYTHTWATFVRPSAKGRTRGTTKSMPTQLAGCPRHWSFASGGLGPSRG